MDFLDKKMQVLSKSLESLSSWEALSPYLIAILTLIIGYIIGRSLSRAAGTIVRQSGSAHGALLTQKIVLYGVFTIAVIFALANLGLKVSGLLATAGIFTVALGFAAQTSVSNVISGFFLLFDRPFSIGDTVKIDTTLGTILSIDLLSTRIRTFDNLMVRIPNEGLLKSTITNYTLYNVRRVEIPISVAFGSDLENVRKIILDIMHEHRLILDEPAAAIIFDTMTDSGVNLLVRAWAERADYITARSELTMGIHNALVENGISIPFPKRIVHLEQTGPWRVETYQTDAPPVDEIARPKLTKSTSSVKPLQNMLGEHE